MSESHNSRKSVFQFMFDGRRSVEQPQTAQSHSDTNKSFSKSWHENIHRLSSKASLLNIEANQSPTNVHDESIHKLLLDQLQLYEHIINQQAELIKNNQEITEKIASIESQSSLLRVSREGSSSSGTGSISQTVKSKTDPQDHSHSLKIGVEMASNFSANKFSSTLATVRQTQVPPSHSLCFMYTSMFTARTLIDQGEVPCRRQCGGVPLSLCGPDERNDAEYTSSENQWMYSAAHTGEVVFALVIPRRLLWSLPSEPDGFVSMDSKSNGPFRVLPASLLAATSASGSRTTLQLHSIARRVYHLGGSLPNGLGDDENGALNARDHNIDAYDSDEDGFVDDDDDDAMVVNDDLYMDNVNVGFRDRRANFRRVDAFRERRSTMVEMMHTDKVSPVQISTLSVEKYLAKMTEMRQEYGGSSMVLLYHYTDPALASSILSNGLRMSTQGQGDGGVYFSMLGPASFGYGVDGSYERRLIEDCFGQERLGEYEGKGRLDLLLVCAVEEGLLSPAPGGRDNATMVGKEIFEALSVPSPTGQYHLSPKCICAAIMINPKTSLKNGADGDSSGSSLRELIQFEAERDKETVHRIHENEKKLRKLSGFNDIASLPPSVPKLPRGFLPRQSVLQKLKFLLQPTPSQFLINRKHGASSSSFSSQPSFSPRMASKTTSAASFSTIPSSSNSMQGSPSFASSSSSSRLPRSSTMSSQGSSHGSSSIAEDPNERIVVLGMGGAGKTLLVASLIQDIEVRSNFDKIVWISLGMEPDIGILQESAHLQLCGKSFPPVINGLPDSLVNEAKFQALVNAAANMKVLLVLDDVWDANVIDPAFAFLSHGSKTVVSTRIKGLFREGATEVGVDVLDTEEAMSLLLTSSGVGELAPDTAEYKWALQVVKLTGGLPLTLAIAAGLIEANGSEVTAELVSVMKQDRLRSATFSSTNPNPNQNKDEPIDDSNDGMIERTLEGRIIMASLSRFKGRSRKLTLAVFSMFACFPEDTSIPITLFDTLAPFLVSLHQSSGFKVSSSSIPESGNNNYNVDNSNELSTNFLVANLNEKILIQKQTSFAVSSSSSSNSNMKPKSVSIDLESTSSPTQNMRKLRKIQSGSSASAKQAVVLVRRCLSELLKCHLILGSFERGLVVHDIVRDFLLSRQTRSSFLRVQKILTNILISTRPQNITVSIFGNEKHKEFGLGHYITNKLHFHMYYSMYHSLSVSYDPISDERDYENSDGEGVNGGRTMYRGNSDDAGEMPRRRLDSRSLRLSYTATDAIPPPPPIMRSQSSFSPRSPGSSRSGQLNQRLPVNKIPEYWLEHRDLVVRISLALALGSSIVSLVNHLEEQGEFLNAARVAFLPTLLDSSKSNRNSSTGSGSTTTTERNLVAEFNHVDLLFRAADLIEKRHEEIQTQTAIKTTLNEYDLKMKQASGLNAEFNNNNNDDDGITKLSEAENAQKRVSNEVEEDIDVNMFDFEWQVVQACSLRRWGTPDLLKAMFRVKDMLKQYNNQGPLQQETSNQSHVHAESDVNKKKKTIFLHPLAKYEMTAMRVALGLHDVLKHLDVKLDATIQPNPTEANIEQGLKVLIKRIPFIEEAAQLAPHESLYNMMRYLYHSRLMSFVAMLMSHYKEWEQNVGLEKDLMDGINAFNPNMCHVISKHVGQRIDPFLDAIPLVSLFYYFGNLSSLEVWCDKAITIYSTAGLDCFHNYDHLFHEVLGTLSYAVPILLCIDDGGQSARALLESIGFPSHHQDVFKHSFHAFWTSSSNFIARRDAKTTKSFETLIRLMVFLASPASSSSPSSSSSSSPSSSSPSLTKDNIDIKTVSSPQVSVRKVFNQADYEVHGHDDPLFDWLPLPAELVEMDQNRYEIRLTAPWNLIYFGALAYLKIKKYKEAKEIACLGLVKGNTLKHNVIVGCHCVLGSIAALENDLPQSSQHFMNAVEASLYSRLPMLELLTYRSWKNSILLFLSNKTSSSPSHQASIEKGLKDMELMIEETCQKMGQKSSADLRLVINFKN